MKTWLLVVNIVVHMFGDSSHGIEYAKKGKRAILKCPYENPSWFSVTTRKVIAIGSNVNPELKFSNRLSVTKHYDLVISNTTSSDFQTYRCSGRDNEGIIQSRDIILRPVVYPSNMTVIEESDPGVVNGIQNRNISLTCAVASGDPEEDLSWTSNDEVLTSGGPGYLRYTFTPHQFDNLRNFTCIAENTKYGYFLSYSVELRLILTPSVAVFASPNSRIIEGSEFELECQNVSEHVNSFSWKRDGVFLVNDTQILRFNASSSHGGTYTCIGRNDAGEGSDDIRINVLYPVKVEATDMIIYESDKQKKIVCKVSGNPDQFHFGKWTYIPEFDNESRFLDLNGNGTITFEDFDYEDAGIYVCNATNKIADRNGNIWQTGNISVEYRGKPRLTRVDMSMGIGYIRNTSSITVDVLSSPEPLKIDWFVKNVRLSNVRFHYTYSATIVSEKKRNRTIYLKGYKCTLTIKKTKLEDFQNYTIRVSNQFGHMSAVIRLRYAGPPEKPSVVTLASTFHSIFVEWEPGFDGGYNQIFCVEYREHTSGFWIQLTPTDEQDNQYIYGLKPDIKYILRLYSYNSMGNSGVTKQYEIRTKERPNGRSSVLYATSIVSVIMFSISGIFICYWCYSERGRNTGENDCHYKIDIEPVYEEVVEMEEMQQQQNQEIAAEHVLHPVNALHGLAGAAGVAGVAGVNDEGYSSIDRRRRISSGQMVSYKAARHAKVVSTEV